MIRSKLGEEISMNLIIIAAVLLLTLLVLSFALFGYQDEREIDEENRTQWEQDRAQFQECVNGYMRNLSRIKNFTNSYSDEGGANIKITSSIPSEACRLNLSPVYYPRWNCSDYQREQPAFPNLLSVPVNHDGFDNWTWPAPFGGGIRFDVSLGKFEQSYYALNRTINGTTLIFRNMTEATCGFWDAYFSTRTQNLSGQNCEHPGRYHNTTRLNNYACCVRNLKNRAFCVDIPQIEEKLSCKCEEVTAG